MSFRIHSGRALQAPAGLSRRALMLGAVAATCTLSAPSGALARDRAAPPLMLAEVYRRGMPLDDHWVSEKYDGVRGYWDGKQLWTRGGERIIAPPWFTASLPAVPMDGELWAGRGRFAQAVSTVRSQTPNDAAWHELHFMVFDLPAQPATSRPVSPSCESCCRSRMRPGWCRSRSSAQRRTSRSRHCSTRRCAWAARA
jgi:DNA ligase-1